MSSSADHIKWIEYKGKQIIFVDYSNINDKNEYINRVEQFNNFLIKQNKYDLLTIFDNRNSYISHNEMLLTIKKSAKIGKKYAKKTAAVGVSETQKIFIKTINLFSDLGLKPFNSMEEAKEWLVEE